MAAASPMFGRMISLAVETGLRQEELAGLEHRQIDVRRREITLTETKTSRPRVVALSDAALSIISGTPRRLRKPGERDYLLWRPDGGRYYQASSLFARLCKRVGVRMRFHDLRHAYARNFLRAGGDIYSSKAQLGHSSVKVTEQYLFNVTADQHQQVAKLSAKIGNMHDGLATPDKADDSA